MGRQDWFRRTTWTPTDEREFRSRLNRSRGAFHKSQYLYIQGLTLFETKEPELVEAALGLAEENIRDFPAEFDVGPARYLKARCLQRLGRHSEVVPAYKDAIATHPNPSETDATLDYCLYVALHGLQDHYQDALSLIVDQRNKIAHMPFPIRVFKCCHAAALIYHEVGDAENSRICARIALQMADAQRGPSSRHPSFGLVRGVGPSTLGRLRELAGPEESR